MDFPSLWNIHKIFVEKGKEMTLGGPRNLFPPRPNIRICVGQYNLQKMVIWLMSGSQNITSKVGEKLLTKEIIRRSIYTTKNLCKEIHMNQSNYECWGFIMSKIFTDATNKYIIHPCKSMKRNWNGQSPAFMELIVQSLKSTVLTTVRVIFLLCRWSNHFLKYWVTCPRPKS